MDDNTSVMNTGEGDQLAWQLRQCNSRSSSEFVTTGELLLKKLPWNSTRVTALRTILSKMTSGIGKCVADGSHGSDDHKRARQTICQEHLDRHAREGDAFLHRTVTGDESWVYHYEPESKRQSMHWNHPSSPANKKFKTQASAGKVMLTIFWDVSGPILVHFQEKGQTVTCVRYSDMLVNELKPAIRSKRRELLSKRVLFLHDNARPHTAAHTVDTLSALKFEFLKHPHIVRTWRHRTFTCLDL
jgi:histone-lysine N-methyltransferase SETMAR